MHAPAFWLVILIASLWLPGKAQASCGYQVKIGRPSAEAIANLAMAAHHPDLPGPQCHGDDAPPTPMAPAPTPPVDDAACMDNAAVALEAPWTFQAAEIVSLVDEHFLQPIEPPPRSPAVSPVP